MGTVGKRVCGLVWFYGLSASSYSSSIPSHTPLGHVVGGNAWSSGHADTDAASELERTLFSDFPGKSLGLCADIDSN